ncbi:interferon alpha-inducible protein 27-like protein 2 [Tachyglossus aculeatus]|uniref:interferon alpha-inducible protein 27-like protein 2 n=1 Tax=Tachyglossus aculeatus TaxID=9261 RepID=UPI0018F5A995|nr:interferon alpha-inducible protein 27-like protein 2 [Tachyglossus aculeatus]
MGGLLRCAVIGGAVMVYSVPLILGAVGFKGAGIAAGSIASRMMSTAAVANGGGIVAGRLVAILKSVGAVGLSSSVSKALGMAGATIGATLPLKLIAWPRCQGLL